jgi:hypothetical protein
VEVVEAGTVVEVVVGELVVVVVGGIVVVVVSTAIGGLVEAGASGAFHSVKARTPSRMPPPNTTRNLKAELDTS